MSNAGLLAAHRALATPFSELRPFFAGDKPMFDNANHDFALGAGGAFAANFAIGGPFVYYEWEALFGTSPTIGTAYDSLLLPVPSLPAPTATVVGGTGTGDSGGLSGTNVCIGNCHLASNNEVERMNFFPAVVQSDHGYHPHHQSIAFLPCDDEHTLGGTNNVAVGSTSRVISHGLNATPLAQDILVTPISSSQASSVTQWWVDTITSTQFTVHATAAAAGNVASAAWSFSWRASIRNWLLGLVGFPFNVNANSQLKGSCMYRWR